MANWLRLAGLEVIEFEGWMTRGRSSGGFDPGFPVCMMWHHDASAPNTNPRSTAEYACYNADAKPICNLQVDRTGKVWVLAAGATNTNGSGGPVSLPSGKTVPLDKMNTQAVGIEICNNGVGEEYPAVQIDACFKTSIAIANNLGIPADDAMIHQVWAPTRKIDPAVAYGVQGSFKPHSITSSGTWSLIDLQAELRLRSQSLPLPDDEDDDMARSFVRHGDVDSDRWNAYIVFSGGKFWIPTGEALARVQNDFGYAPIPVDDVFMDATGPVIGPNPGDQWGKWKD